VKLPIYKLKNLETTKF